MVSVLVLVCSISGLAYMAWRWFGDGWSLLSGPGPDLEVWGGLVLGVYGVHGLHGGLGVHGDGSPLTCLGPGLEVSEGRGVVAG